MRNDFLERCMENFQINKVKLEAASASEQLRLARQEKGISVKQAARYLEVNSKHLIALETCNYRALPPGMYSRSYLREYSYFLGLNYRKLLIIFEQEKSAMGCSVDKSDYFTKLNKIKKSVFFIPGIMKNVAIVVSVWVCLMYIGSAVLNIFTPPVLEVYSPDDNLIMNDPNVDIVGKADGETQVVINGELVANTGGYFKRSVYLRDGINIINISANRKFGNSTILQRRILVDK